MPGRHVFDGQDDEFHSHETLHGQRIETRNGYSHQGDQAPVVLVQILSHNRSATSHRHRTMVFQWAFSYPASSPAGGEPHNNPTRARALLGTGLRFTTGIRVHGSRGTVGKLCRQIHGV